jgi:large subunit ribosomal protein L22
MEVKAKLRYLRIAPRKVRLVADLIRGKNVEEAKLLLDFSLKKAARPLKKLLESAIANAKNNFDLEEKTLRIAKVTVDEGPKLKRWRARARGRAYEIQKKTSHITIVLEGEKVALSGKKEEKEVKKGAKEEKPTVEKKAEIESEEKEKPKAQLSKQKPLSTKQESKIKPKPEKKGLKRIFKRKAF